MLWIYDDAIVEDLKRSFNPDNVSDPAVTVVNPENAIALAAQVQDDKIQFPVVALTRSSPISIAEALKNFTKTKKGVSAVFDNENNIIYNEKTLPIELSYELSVFTTNTADMDEIIRELVFKYSSQYFMTATIPYESKRKIKFGVSMDNTDINIQSSTSGYIAEGSLYSSAITLRCEGCVLVHYTPRKLKRIVTPPPLSISGKIDTMFTQDNVQ